MSAPDFQCAELPEQLRGIPRAVYALGTFDGVHLGHRRVLEGVAELGRKCGAHPVAIFFDPSPKELFAGRPLRQRLISTADKLKCLKELGMKAAVCWPFTRELAALSPAQFLEKYFFGPQAPAAAGFAVGEDWHFGRDNAGNAETLRELAAARGAQVLVVPHFCDEGGRISSTRIRTLISGGKVSEAEKLLGHPFCLSGTVSAGAGIAGGKLHCPTANLQDDRMILPPYGVYAALVGIDDEAPARPGIVYIGDAPTIRGENNGLPIVEIHLFDFSGDLYGRNVSVRPAAFLRPSMRFPDQEALKRQIAADVAETRRILKI